MHSSVLQPPALSREHRQSHPSRRLLRARSSHPAGKRKDQTQDHPKPSVASPQTSRVTSTMMRQTLSWFTPPPVSKSLTTDSDEYHSAERLQLLRNAQRSRTTGTRRRLIR